MRVKAGARHEKISGVRGGRLLIYVKAPPKEGKANKSVRSLIAKALNVPKSRVEIVRGEKSRDKTVHIVSLSRARTAELIDGQI